jgi:hypothetical protein
MLLLYDILKGASWCVQVVQYLFSNVIRSGTLIRAEHVTRKHEILAEFCWVILLRRCFFEGLREDGRMILNWIIRKGMWMELACDRDLWYKLCSSFALCYEGVSLMTFNFYEGRLKSSWTHLVTPSRNFVEVRWRSLFRSTSLGKWFTSYNAPPTSPKRSASKFLASELPFHGWKSPEIAWSEVWIVWRML